MGEERQTSSGLQIVRAFAAMLVVWIHTSFELEQHGFELGIIHPDDLYWAGTFGVDLFFVLSGYIITRTAFITRRQEAGAFLMRRALRILPLYWVLTLLCLMAALVEPSMEADWPNLLVALTFWPVWNGAITFPVLAAGWSLNFEMTFYAAAAFCLLGGRRMPLLVAGVIALYALIAASRLLHETPATRMLGSGLILEFLAGVALAGVSRTWRPRPWLGLMLVISGIWTWLQFSSIANLTPFHFDAPKGHEDFLRAAVFIPPAAAIVIGALLVEPWARTSWLKPFVYLGDASYSMYLIHSLVILLLVRRVFVFAPIGWAQPLALACMCAAILASIATYEIVERPLLRAVRIFGLKAINSEGAASVRT